MRDPLTRGNKFKLYPKLKSYPW